MQAGVVQSLKKEAATYMGVPAKLREPLVNVCTIAYEAAAYFL
jgi:hypothetical protein